jgi:hypothetical protein
MRNDDCFHDKKTEYESSVMIESILRFFFSLSQISIEKFLPPFDVPKQHKNVRIIVAKGNDKCKGKSWIYCQEIVNRGDKCIPGKETTNTKQKTTNPSKLSLLTK